MFSFLFAKVIDKKTPFEEALSYFNEPLPLPATKLDTQIKRIPDQLYSYELKNVISIQNGQMIFSHFCQMSELVGQIFVLERLQHKEKIEKIIQKLTSSVFKDYPYFNKQYAKQIEKQLKKDKEMGDDIIALQKILTLTTKYHCHIFQLGKNNRSKKIKNKGLDLSVPIPEKYQYQINCVISKNFYVIGSSDETKQSIEADKTASVVRKAMFDQQSSIKFQNTDKMYPKMKDFTKSVLELALLKSGINKGTDLLSSLVLFTEKQEIQKRQIEYLFESSYKKLISTYYERNMMIHLSNLILQENSRFKLDLIRGQPALKLMIDLLQQEIINFETLKMKQQQGPRKIVNDNNITQKYEEKVKPEVENTIPAMNKNRKLKLFRCCNSKFKRSQKMDLAQQYQTQAISKQESLSQFRPLEEDIIQTLKSLINQILPLTVKYSMQSAQNYYEKQIFMIVIIYIYKIFVVEPENQFGYPYTTTKRRIMCSVFSKLVNVKQTTQPPFRNWQLLFKYLENKRRFDVPQITNIQVIEQSEQIINQLYQNHQLLEDPTLYEEGLEMFKGKVPKFKIVNLTRDKNKSKVVHFLISGFLTEEKDKVEEWKDMIDNMEGCEVYGITWQSNTAENFKKFLINSAKNVFDGEKIKKEYSKISKDNPFTRALNVARMTGRMFAQLLPRLFPNQFVCLCGFSLGSLIVQESLYRLIQLNKEKMISSIKFMGGVLDSQQFPDILVKSKNKLDIINCSTQNDQILKNVLTLSRPEMKPIGLYKLPEVQGHSILNIDCTKFIGGHFSYKANSDIMGKLLKISCG